MSADNWTTCPKCKATRDAELSAMLAKVGESYGKIPIAEFDAMRAAYDAEAKKRIEETFREDYEFYGAEDGEVTASYSGGCSKCGLRCQFKHNVTFYPEDGARG